MDKIIKGRKIWSGSGMREEGEFPRRRTRRNKRNGKKRKEKTKKMNDSVEKAKRQQENIEKGNNGARRDLGG